MAARFPHLLAHEARIYARFRAAPPFLIRYEEFDRRLGAGMAIDARWPAWLQHAARVLTQKRVDVIVESDAGVWILEIKRRAGFSALGQLLGYAMLYMIEIRPDSAPRLGVITESLMPDLESVYAQYGISVFLV